MPITSISIPDEAYTRFKKEAGVSERSLGKTIIYLAGLGLTKIEADRSELDRINSGKTQISRELIK